MTNTIIRASAGSGKTFQLSNRYLDILFQREPVDTILASTFTRKAAGEITSRILTRLADAALDNDKRRDLAEHVDIPSSRFEIPDTSWGVALHSAGLKGGVSEKSNAYETLRPIRLVSTSSSRPAGNPVSEPVGEEQEIVRLLADLARNLYRMRISTLDSFFNKLATAFSLELGLPPGWSILEETDYFRFIGEAVRTVLAGGQHHEARRLMNMLQKGEQNRGVTKELFDLATALLPIVRESPAEAWNHEKLLRPELDEAAFQTVLARLETADVPLTQKKTPHGNFLKARTRLVGQAVNDDWSGFLESSLVQSVLSGDCLYYKLPVEGDFLDCVRELITQAHAVIVNKIVAQTKATRELLELVAEAYDDILLRERRFRFEDITGRLSGRELASMLDVLNHRMDAKTAHLLLDEFQDTSMPQWKVMAAFAGDVARNPHGSFFCVGDVKQAIYAWRGGESGIFGTIEDSIPKIETKSMDQSFRSSPVVLAAVNRLFESIVDNAALAKNEAENVDSQNSPTAAELWAEGFSTHQAAPKNQHLPGHVVLEVSPELPEALADETGSYNNDDETEDGVDDPNKPEDTKKTIFVRYVVDRIRELHETRPGQSIGVLVNRNDKIGPIIAGLKRYEIEASEEGGVPLTDSAAVQHVLSALILADHPGDTIAHFHLLHGPLAATLGLYQHDGFRNAVQSGQAVKTSQKIRRELLCDGYGVVVERYAKALAPACNAREFQRLTKLQELAFRFDEAARGTRTRRFVDMIRNTKVESASAAAIRVMTIHKSKGLEFDIVVLPDLEKTLTKNIPLLVTDRKSLADPIHLAIRYVGKEVLPLLPDAYQIAFQNRLRRETVESLSLLYVAMTRAIHELVMIVPPLGKKAKRDAEKGEPTFSSNFAGVLRAGLAFENLPNDAQILYEDYGRGRDAFKNFQAFCASKTEKFIETKNTEPEWLEVALAPTSKQGRRNLPRITPSGMESQAAPPKNDTSTHAVGGRNPEDAKLWGTAIHACFEHGLRQNPWLDQKGPSTEPLEPIVRRAVAGQKGTVDPDAVIKSFQKLCQQPTVLDTLSQKSYKIANGQTVRVEHERRFAVRIDDKLLRGSIDRLVIFEEAGSVIALDIIDYKTDRPVEGRTARALAEERGYLEQLAAYRRGMARLFKLEERQITARLLFVEYDEVVTITEKT